MPSFLERHADKIAGTISCFDRIVIQGTLPGICFSGGMTKFLKVNDIRIFDYTQFTKPLRDEIRENAEMLAEQNGIEIEFVRKPKARRKEEIIKKVIQKRGDHPGLVHILSAMEGCSTYKPWHDKKTHKTFLKPDKGQCLHYYFYFIDETYGLCYVRVPTWCPFRLQVYLNGHNYLASRCSSKGLDHRLMDNAFVSMADYDKAQRLADGMDAKRLHRALDRWARLCCPVTRHFDETYHWSLMQVEYALDIVFKRQADLAPIYEHISRTAIHAVKADNVATFLGRKLTGNYKDELGNDFSTRIEGTRIRHHMGPASIKMYDKFGKVLRIEVTANDVSFFKHHRKVEHRDGTSTFKLAPLKKSIYSLRDLRELLAAANRRYLDFVSTIDDPSVGNRILTKVSGTVSQNGRPYKGFNLFDEEDQILFEVLLRGEHNISGFRNKDLRRRLEHMSSGQVSRLLKRLRTHGLIKRVGRTYKYYLTSLGRNVLATSLKVRNLFVLPQLSSALA
jgi:DNA-binding MarR family transcriptional regulator